MNKIILAPDSFKGTKSAVSICNIMESAIKAHFPACEVLSLPVADGGEGTVEAMLLAGGGQKIDDKVTGPLGDEIDSFYGVLSGGGTAVIEMAAAAGLSMVKGKENPLGVTTFGVGELIAHAVAAGARDILLGLGGSCTNDGGCGAAAALGVVFTNADNVPFIPTGGTLSEITNIDYTECQKRLAGVNVKIMCDVTNPLYGEHGAAYIFGPQKGADENEVKLIDDGLRHLGGLLEQIKPNVSLMPGAGAAGGMGAGMCALLGASLVSGIDGVLDAVRFEEMLGGCDLIISGEGKIDAQSLGGKVIFGVCRRAKPHGVPVIAVVGDAIDEQLAAAADHGLYGVFTTNRRAVTIAEARKTIEADMYATVSNIMSLIKSLKL